MTNYQCENNQKGTIFSQKQIANLIEANAFFHRLKEEDGIRWISVWMQVIREALQEPLKLIGLSIKQTPVAIILNGDILDTSINGIITFDDAANLFSLRVENTSQKEDISQEIYKRFIKILEHYKVPCEFNDGKLYFKPKGLPIPKEEAPDDDMVYETMADFVEQGRDAEAIRFIKDVQKINAGGILETVTISQVQKFRKDFLQVMKAVDKIVDYDDMIHVNKAYNLFRNSFEEFVNNIREGIEEEIWDYAIRVETWHLLTEGLGIYMADDYWTEEMRFKDFLKKKKTYISRIKLAARKAWAVLTEYIEFLDAKQAKPVKITYPTQQIEIDGFKVIMSGELEKDYEKNHFEAFKEALHIFKQKAKVLPILLKKMLPIKLVYSWDFGGQYYGKFIAVNLNEITGPLYGVRIIAHEMSHHIYDSYLSTADKNFWHSLVKNEHTVVDCGLVVNNWPEGIKFLSSVAQMSEKVTDKTLALQLYLLAYKMPNATKKDFEELAASNKKLSVPKFPISQYAQKNDIEAFCEAVAMYVTYRKLPDILLYALKLIIPLSINASIEATNDTPFKEQITRIVKDKFGFFVTEKQITEIRQTLKKEDITELDYTSKTPQMTDLVFQFVYEKILKV